MDPANGKDLSAGILERSSAVVELFIYSSTSFHLNCKEILYCSDIEFFLGKNVFDLSHWSRNLILSRIEKLSYSGCLFHGSGKRCQGTVRWMHRIRAALDKSDAENPLVRGRQSIYCRSPASPAREKAVNTL